MLVTIVLFACVSSFLFGYDLGLIGGALLHINDDFGTDTGTDEVIVGSAKLGAVLGTFLGGALMLHYGRRPAIAIDSIFFLVGPLIMALGWNVACLIIGRFIIGIGIGISAVVVPAYLGEVSPARVRGRVVEMYEVMLCVGMMVSAFIDFALDSVPGNWRWMVGLPIIPAVFMSFALCMIPESPRWLITQGNLDAALAVIHRIYTSTALPVGMQESTAEVESELMDLWSAVEKDKHALGERRRRYLERRRNISRTKNSVISNNSTAMLDSHIGGSTGRTTGGEYSIAGDYDSSALRTAEDSGVEVFTLDDLEDENNGDEDQEDIRNGLTLTQQQQQSGKNLDDMVASEGRTGLLQSHGGPLSDGSEIHPSFQSQYYSPTIQTGGQNNSNRANLYDTTTTNDDHDTSKVEALDAPSFQVEQRNVGFWRTAYDMVLDVAIVAQGPEKRAFRMALALAFFNQAFASTAIINYAPTVLRNSGVESDAVATLFSSFVGASKLLGVAASLFLVDSVGRRPLLIFGSIGCSLSLALLVPADWFSMSWLIVMGMCFFIFCFSVSWAGVFWVLMSEIFSMGAKSPASAAATATLFLTGAVADLSFLSLHEVLGAFSFLVYSLIALAATLYVLIYVPETKEKTLQEVQTLLQTGVTRYGLEGQRLAPNDSSLSNEMSWR